MQLICIGHKVPAFRVPANFHFISPQVIEGYPSIVIPDDILGDPFHGHILSEYTQLFVLYRKMVAEGSTEPVYLFQYRKFLSVREPRHRSTNQSYAFACSQDEAESLFPTERELAMMSEGTVTGPILHNDLMAQYFVSHVPRDIICFALGLATLDGFDPVRLNRFVSCPVVFPAPTVGVFHPEMFIRHMKILETAWAFFYENYYVEREGFQRRVGGFLLERLHSFLLYEEVTNPNRGRILTGHQVVVSDTLEIRNTV